VTSDGIVLRSESETISSDASQQSGKVTIRLQDLVIGPQAPALFEVPAGYQRIGTN
jgi:hypothetical protein